MHRVKPDPNDIDLGYDDAQAITAMQNSRKFVLPMQMRKLDKQFRHSSHTIAQRAVDRMILTKWQ